jgi:hypothetical protein
MNTTTLPCGCKHDDRSWLFLCEPHLLSWFDTHRIAVDEQLPTRTDPPGVGRDA